MRVPSPATGETEAVSEERSGILAQVWVNETKGEPSEQFYSVKLVRRFSKVKDPDPKNADYGVKPTAFHPSSSKERSKWIRKPLHGVKTTPLQAALAGKTKRFLEALEKSGFVPDLFLCPEVDPIGILAGWSAYLDVSVTLRL